MKGWEIFFKEQQQQLYFQQLMEFVREEYKTQTIYPERENLFKVFEVCSYEKVKVVILGQDPYHQPHQAMGLSFSVEDGVKLPPSLRNIYKELESDLGIVNDSGDLTPWVDQGVFLLNTVLSVRAGEPLSHQKRGWETFTDHTIEYLSKRDKPIIFILWGAHAQSKEKMIASHHYIIKGAHPSPLSAYRGFFGSRPFSKVNQHLISEHEEEINWRL